MHRDGVRLLFAVLLTIWFGIIVPGHERGVVSLPGMGPGAGSGKSGDSCCAVKTEGKDGAKPEKGAPCDPVRRCALCYIIGVLDAPGTLGAVLPQPELLALIDVAAPQSVAMVFTVGLPPERGPPVV